MQSLFSIIYDQNDLMWPLKAREDGSSGLSSGTRLGRAKEGGWEGEQHQLDANNKLFNTHAVNM